MADSPTSAPHILPLPPEFRFSHRKEACPLKPSSASDKTKKILAAFFVLLYLTLSALLLVYVGKPFIAFLDQPEKFQQWIDARGLAGQAVFLFMIVLQVFVAVIPGEPLEIAAGYAFGWFGGTLLCLIGVAAGSAIVFALVRRYGTRALELFLPHDKIRSMKFLQNTERLKSLMFVLFLIPGTPKDLLTYIAGLTPIRMSDFLILSTVARIPSLVTSIVGGSALGDGEYLTAVIVFAVTAAFSILGLLVYSKIKQHKTQA